MKGKNRQEKKRGEHEKDSLRPSSGGLGAIFGRLGGSWGVFGGFQVPLGASRGALGRS